MIKKTMMLFYYEHRIPEYKTLNFIEWKYAMQAIEGFFYIKNQRTCLTNKGQDYFLSN